MRMPIILPIMASTLDHPNTSNELASDWMHRGIDLLNTSSPASLEEAVRCFDQAITLRRTLPLDENPRHRYGLAAGWMNRGDALARLGESAQLADSIKSYDEALRVLHSLPLDEDALYPRRLAIAWINRGFALQKEETAEAEMEAIRSFREALEVLEDSPAVAIADLDLLRAGALTNLAGALLNAPDPAIAEARIAVQQALVLLKDIEHDDATAAEAGFKARHVLCRTVAAQFRDGQAIPLEVLTVTTDAVDEGLILARHWEQHGESRFRVLAEDLFRFGCRIYQTGQPHFLTEFILENIDSEKADGIPLLNQDMHEAAMAALWNALKEIQREDFQSFSTPRFEQVLDNLRDLRVTEERLEQLRRLENR